MSSSLRKQAFAAPMGASSCRRVSRDMTQLRQLGGVTTPRAKQKQKTRYKDGRCAYSEDNRWANAPSEQKSAETPSRKASESRRNFQYAVQDSNLWPSAPEADALSN